MPASSSDFSKEKYQDVVSDLKDAGFTDVESDPLGDLIVGLLHKPGDVKDISVNGSKDDFDKGATFKKDAKIVVEYHSDLADSSPSPSMSESSSASSSEAPSSDAEPDVLTPANNTDLAALLKVTDPGSPKVAAFSKKYLGKTIEFDGNVAAVGPDGNYKTLENVMINAGDFNPNTAVGPDFQFSGLSIYDIPGGGQVGDNVHVKAEVGSYDAETQLLQLQSGPNKVTSRN